MDDWDSVTKIGARPAAAESLVRRSCAARARSTPPKEAALSSARRRNTVLGICLQTRYRRSASDQGRSIRRYRQASTVGKEVGSVISERRQKMEPKMTQKDLATKCNTTASIVADFERGTAAPDQKILASMERVLGIKLRGSDIGAPKFGPKKK